MKKIAILAVVLLLNTFSVLADEYGGKARIASPVHDFGTVSTSDGPLSCSFTVENISDEPLTIYTVVSSCGCTNVKWTHETIAPGAQGSITATYSNDEGAFPFDKALTAYISGVKSPIVLHLKGVVKKNSKK